VSEDLAVRVCPRHNQVLEEKGDNLICPGPQRHRVQRWKVVNTRTERALYQASHEGTEAVLNDTTKLGEKPQAKSKTIERAKLQDGGGQTLWLRVTHEPKKYGGEPYRVRWSQDDGKKVTGGVAKTCPDEASGKRAFAAAVAEAIRDGWKQIPVTSWGGARKLTLKPIPKPKKRA
jgi:hypothetical protein